ncbi:MAG TPA: cation diffusion facilitator family transporter [Acidimicrobiales bacterium]
MASARADLSRYGWLSVATALTTMALKAGAWLLTGSVGLLSDALESTVNLVAALLTVLALRLATRPPDANHEYGHEKAEFFSAGAEGLMIVVAAVVIAVSAIDRLLNPRELDQLGAGLAISVVAALANMVVSVVLQRAGRRHESIALVADGRHLMTDVVTSACVLAGVLLVALTDWGPLDPIVALAAGAFILTTGIRLLTGAGMGLMDPSLPAVERRAVEGVLAQHADDGVVFHALRTRVAGPRRYVSVHVLVPGAWTVATGHDLLERIEADLQRALPGLVVLTHLEPLESPASYDDD